MKDIFPLKENLYKNSVYKEEIKRLEEILRLKNKFSILIGVRGMTIFILSRGLFNLGKINVEDRRTSSYDKIFNANLTPDLDSISYVMQMYNETGEQAYRIFVINCDFIRENICQIANASSLFVDIIYLRLLIQKHMKEIEESWEDCLSLFERGIMEYSKKKEHTPNWSLRTDFMEMLLFGCCNKEFWSILDESLSLCGVKSISGTVTKMSSHIINHCCPNMHFTLMRLLFHTHELANLIKFPSEYGFLNLTRETMSEMTDACGSTLLKLHEFQTILSDNIHNLNLFFQWINHGIDNHLSEAHVSHSFSYSQLATIMDFVTNKLRVVKDANGDIVTYKIEILHQYLVEADLCAPQLVDSHNFLLNLIKSADRGDLSDGFFSIRHEKSLTNMVRSFLPDIIDTICWKHENSFITNHSNPLESYPITLATFNFDVDEDNVLVVSESYSDDTDSVCVEVCAFYHPSVPILIWTQNKTESVKSCAIHLNRLLGSNADQNIKIIRLQFYNSSTLFLLVAIEHDGATENSYVLVLSWNMIEASHADKIREHGLNQLVKESFTIWPCGNHHWVQLSDLLTAESQELLPIDAIDMTISCKRRLALVFFGRSRERCRIFVLEDI